MAYDHFLTRTIFINNLAVLSCNSRLLVGSWLQEFRAYHYVELRAIQM